MSVYTYTDEDRDAFQIVGVADTKSVFAAILPRSGSAASTRIDNADVPTVALEFLKASASDWSTQPVELVAIVASLERYVKANDPKVKLQERRDAVKAELVKAMLNRTEPTDMTQAAIDRIIELEDGATP